MAVKEYATEAANQRSERLNYNVTKILEFIEQISQNIEQDVDRPTVCCKIVNLLGHVDIPKLPELIKGFHEKIKKVDHFLKTLAESHNLDEVVSACLKELNKIIITIDQPSPAAGIVLHLIELNQIPEVSKWFLVHSDYTSDDEIRRGVNTLMSWISSSHFLPTLRHWIIGILRGLCELKKYRLLMEIAEVNIDNLLMLSAVPTFNEFVWPIILHMLESIQHSPVVFHRVLKLYVKANAMKLPNDPQLAKQLENIMAALLLHFPNHEDTEQVRNKLRPSSNFRDSLDVPTWHDQGKVIKRKTNVRVGLINLGNTCYMNSVLQALMLSKQFTRDLLMADVRTPLFQNMQKLMALLLHSDRPELMPSAVLQTARPVGFHPGHEQDSSEFLGHLLDQLHEQEKPKLALAQHAHQQPLCSMDLEAAVAAAQSSAAGGSETAAASSASAADAGAGVSDGARSVIDAADTFGNNMSGAVSVADGTAAAAATSRHQLYHSHSQSDDSPHLRAPPTIIQKSFGGVISITYKCLECQTESKQYDAFRDLHLSFPDPESNTPHSVQELLDFYCTAERLDADNKYFCDQCKRLCVGERNISIVSAPFSLILTLKHFKYDQKYNMRAKLMHKVHHEEVIRVRLCTGADRKDACTLYYRLYAAVVHSGVSMETGHYFTYGTDASGMCYRFDDSYVCRTNVAELHNLQPPQTPYILFYQRVDEPALSYGQQQQMMMMSPRKSPKLLPSTSATALGNAATAAAAVVIDDGAVAMGIGCGPRSPNNNINNNKTAAAAAAAGSASGYGALNEYPALEDLPPQLREHVNRDNIEYSEEARRAGREENSSVLARNRRNDSYQPDDDDDSNGGTPGSCSANFAPSYNRYIS